jgi:nitrogen fixation/metabolism regulation signal transduction histidine kinase
MVWNRFNILVLVQILLIALVGLLMTFSIRADFLKMTTIGLIILWVGQILFLNVYMNRIHRDVSKFMEGMRSRDTTQYFNEKKAGPYYARLYKSFNEITRNFRLVRIEKEVENHFFREALKHSASGLMAVTEDGELSLVNDAALQILGTESLKGMKELEEMYPELARWIQKGEPGNQQFKILVGARQSQLALKSKLMYLDGNPVNIISLLDITREMDWQEVEAWQKLIRVLNHEITNSVVPLHLLSTSLHDLFHDGTRQLLPEELDGEIVDRCVLGLETLIKRSSGLSDFINSYKSFTDVGEADRTVVSVSRTFRHIESLMANELSQAGITLKVEVIPADLQLLVDEKLLEQTLINLVKNAVFALEGAKDPLIRCKAYVLEEAVSLDVSDNGRGIPEEIREHIFTPFFTTRKEGSGIGLSLARQVMHMHKGSIRVSSREGEGTTFTLSF